MKISTRGRYGLRALTDIVTESAKTGGAVNISGVARRQGIPEKYLEQIIAVLKKSGYLQSVRGAGGGYIPAKPADQITAGEILRTLEGSLAPADCLDDDNAACGTASCEKCAAKGILSKIYDSLNNIVDSVTIQDIIDEISEKEDRS